MSGTLHSGTPITGILLTGGSSTRMGFDKASMPIGGVRCAVRVASVLQAVVADAIEVGPGVSGLPAVREEPPGCGPLVALCAGARALNDMGGARPALVLACDLPLITETILRTLADWPGICSVVPVINGRQQPLCARWSAEDLAATASLIEDGMRSMRSLLERPGVKMLTEEEWPDQVDPRSFFDVDTPADLERIVVSLDAPSSVMRPIPPCSGHRRAL